MMFGCYMMLRYYMMLRCCMMLHHWMMVYCVMIFYVSLPLRVSPTMRTSPRSSRRCRHRLCLTTTHIHAAQLPRSITTLVNNTAGGMFKLNPTLKLYPRTSVTMLSRGGGTSPSALGAAS
eukprot:gene12010-biopygen5659